MWKFGKPFCLIFLVIVVLSSCASRKSSNLPLAARAATAMSNLNSKPLYKFITSWVGTPYKLGGFDKKGIDCSGFALQLQQEIFKLKLPRRSVDQSRVINEKSIQQLREGDLIFFSFGGKEIDHVGIFLNQTFFVHASTTRGVIVDDLSIPAYQRAFVKAGSIQNK